MTVHTDDRLFNTLGQAMALVDQLRVRLQRDDLLSEFLMRRAILRGKFAITQRNVPEAHRTLKMLAQFIHGASV